MARGTQEYFVLSTLLLLSCLPFSILAAPKKPSSVVRREDIPFIKCQVCEKIAQQIYEQVEKKAAQIAPKKVSEFQIIEIAENVCNLKKAEADWILHIDIVEKGDKLELVDQGVEGQCNSECKTIERACQEVLGYSDTDLAEFLFKSKPSVEKLIDFLCKDLSNACSVKPRPVPKNRIPGEQFVAKSSKEAEMEKIMKSMEGMPGGQSMKMYSREDLMNMNKFGNEDADDDDEDEDKFPANLGKILKEDSPKKDLKQRILHGISETGNVMKSHLSTVSEKLSKWWRGKKAATKPTKTGKVEL